MTAISSSSFCEPMNVISPHSHLKNGSGSPQNRFREMHQSPILLSQSSMRLPA